MGYFTAPASLKSSGTAELSHAESRDAPNEVTGQKANYDPHYYRINQFFRARFEALMNTAYSNRITITICPNFLEAPDPISEDSYEAWHAWFIEPGTKLKTPPLRYPFFSLDQFCSEVPEGMTLAYVDKTLAAGWANRRETKPYSDIKTETDLFQVSFSVQRN